MRCVLIGKMKELQLQPRLQHLANLIPQGVRLVDIGTDHGYLPVWLIQQGRIDRAIAADIAQEPLAHAKRTAEEYDTENIHFRLCSGLDGIGPEEVDYIVIAGMGGDMICHILDSAFWCLDRRYKLIAGMGGDTIVSILSAAPWTKNGVKLLLQPMTKVEMLRSWLADNGYCFTAESLVWDKEYLYPVMEVTGGTQKKLTAAEQWAGTEFADDPLYGEYLTHQILRLQKAIDGLNKANDGRSRGRACELEEIRKALEEKRKTL